MIPLIYVVYWRDLFKVQVMLAIIGYKLTFCFRGMLFNLLFFNYNVSDKFYLVNISTRNEIVNYWQVWFGGGGDLCTGFQPYLLIWNH